MRIRGLFGILFLLSLKTQIADQKSSGGNKLKRVVESTALVKRLVHGIGVHSAFFEEVSDFDDMLAEILGAPSGDTINGTLELKTDKNQREVEEFSSKINTVSIYQKSTANVKHGMQVLAEMKPHFTLLESDMVGIVTTLEAAVDSGAGGEQPNRDILLNFPIYETLEKNLQEVIDDDSNKNTHQRGKILISLISSLVKFTEQPMPQLSKYKTRFSKYIDLETVTMAKVDKFAKISDAYAEKFGDMQNLQSDAATIEPQIDALNSLFALHDQMKQVALAINDCSKITSSLTPSAVGNPEAMSDLEQLEKDLRSDGLKPIISEGKDISALRNSLKPLESFRSSMNKLVNSFTDMVASQSVVDLTHVELKLTELFNNDVVNTRVQNEKADVTFIKGCTAGLAAPEKVDMSNYPTISKFVTDISTDAKKFKLMMENITGDTRFQTFTTALEGIENDLKIVNSDKSDYQIESKWKYLKTKNEDLKNIVSFTRDLREKLSLFKSSMNLPLPRIPNFQPVHAIAKRMMNTKLVEVLQCLQPGTYNSTRLDEVLGFANNVEMLKSDITKSVKYFSDMSAVKKGIEEMREFAKKTKNQKQRKRRAVNQKSLFSLANPRVIANHLAEGVRVLQKMVKIQEAEEDVLAVVEADRGVSDAVDSIPRADEVWTDENRRLMRLMVQDLNKLDEFAGTLQDSRLLTLSSVLERAATVQGPEIDAEVFQNPISTSLSTNPDPKIKAASKNFQSVGSLDLSFVQHKTNLKAASGTFDALNNYFNDLFDIDTSVKTKIIYVTKPPLINWPLTGGITGAVLIILAVAGGIFYFYRRHEIKKELKQRYANPERYYLYSSFTMQAENNILLAAKEGNVEETERHIKDGSYINVYDADGNTSLHLAVKGRHPEIVEMLIKNGADVTLIDMNRRTPERLAAKMITQTKDPAQLEKLHAIQNLFKMYEGHTFTKTVPKKLPTALFMIGFDCSIEDKPMAMVFKKRFPALLANGASKISHFVVDTGDDYIFDIDRLPDVENDPDKLHYLLRIFSPPVLVTYDWILAICVKGKKYFEMDDRFQVTHVRYRGKVYDTILDLKNWMRGYAIPPLTNALMTYNSWTNDISAGRKSLMYMLPYLGGTLVDFEDFADDYKEWQKKRMFWYPRQSALSFLFDTAGESKEPALDKFSEFVKKNGFNNNDLYTMHIGYLFEQLLEKRGYEGLKGCPDYSPKKKK